MTLLPGGYEPDRIVVAGDWHGRTTQAVAAIRTAAGLLADQSYPVIVHCGDFGIWPGAVGLAYLSAVSRELARTRGVLLFGDGNHEDFTRLDALAADADEGGWPLPEPVPVTGNRRVLWLRRGARWRWHGREWLALGGGVSLDKARRTEGRDWWPQEAITPRQEEAVSAAGPADVMVTHDCPAGVVHAFPPPPAWWDLADIARSDPHRERLQRIVDTVRPSYLMHGHLHIGYQRMCDFGYGPVQVTGLDCEGETWNYAVLDVRSMEWAAG